MAKAAVKGVIGPIVPYLDSGRLRVNDLCKNLEAWQIIAYTSGITITAAWIYDIVYNSEQPFTSRAKKRIFRLLRKIPFVKAKIQEEMEKTSKDLEDGFHKAAKGEDYVQTLPKIGYTEEKLMKELQTYKGLVDVDWSTGSCSGCVYSGEEELAQLMAKVYVQFAWTNPLHADVFPDIRKMEAEVVRMTCNIFNGSLESCGCMTTGGTESIMLACKAYRDLALEKDIRYPEMVIPVTAHAAFDKAAQFFRMGVKHVAVDPVTRKVNIAAMKRAITKNTCMLVGSAPQFPHGVIDPIQEIGKLGVKYDIPVHVDSCLGGFIVPFMKKAGFHVDPFDFSVPGVTSISADTHKYGQAPKGSSVIVYRNTELRKYQYFVQPDWPGGIYASPTFAGSRAGAIIAACWATLMYKGEQGYVDATRDIINTARYIEKGIKDIPHLHIVGKAEVSVIAFGSDDFNIYRLSDDLTRKGYNLNALQFPSCVHLCCTLVHTKEGVADKFLKDVRDCVTEIMKNPGEKCTGQGSMYGMAQSIPDRSLVGELVGSFFDAYYCTIKPEKMANGTA